MTFELADAVFAAGHLALQGQSLWLSDTAQHMRDALQATGALLALVAPLHEAVLAEVVWPRGSGPATVLEACVAEQVARLDICEPLQVQCRAVALHPPGPAGTGAVLELHTAVRRYRAAGMPGELIWQCHASYRPAAAPLALPPLPRAVAQLVHGLLDDEDSDGPRPPPAPTGSSGTSGGTDGTAKDTVRPRTTPTYVTVATALAAVRMLAAQRRSALDAESLRAFQALTPSTAALTASVATPGKHAATVVFAVVPYDPTAAAAAAGAAAPAAPAAELAAAAAPGDEPATSAAPPAATVAAAGAEPAEVVPAAGAEQAASPAPLEAAQVVIHVGTATVAVTRDDANASTAPSAAVHADVWEIVDTPTASSAAASPEPPSSGLPSPLVAPDTSAPAPAPAPDAEARPLRRTRRVKSADAVESTAAADEAAAAPRRRVRTRRDPPAEAIAPPAQTAADEPTRLRRRRPPAATPADPVEVSD